MALDPQTKLPYFLNLFPPFILALVDKTSADVIDSPESLQSVVHSLFKATVSSFRFPYFPSH
jgi:hypothetical protein